MGQFLAAELEALGAEVQQRPLGKQPGKEHLDLPPVVIARYGNDKNKRTILVYGHYDVQPAGVEDGWATDPWVLTVDDKDRMYGRGSTDDKGPGRRHPASPCRRMMPSNRRLPRLMRTRGGAQPIFSVWRRISE